MTDENFKIMVEKYGMEYMERFFPRILKSRKWMKDHGL